MSNRKATAALSVVRDSGPFIVRNAERFALGRFNIGDPLGPVPDAFAYVYPTYEEAEAVARMFPGARIEAFR